MPSVSGGGGGGVQFATVTLADAQIKALPHPTPIQVVAAPGNGYMLVVVSSVWRLDNTAGLYTNIAALGVTLNYGATTTLASTQYDESAQGAFADSSAIHLLGVFVGATDGATGNAAWFADRARVNNAALMVSASNGGGGDMTGGNAANTLTVNVAYRVIAV